MGVPGADDIMLNYQSTSYHDVLAMRELLGLAPAPEFADWLTRMGLMTESGRIRPRSLPARFPPLIAEAPMSVPVSDDPWTRMRGATPARIGLRARARPSRPATISRSSSPMPAPATPSTSRSIRSRWSSAFANAASRRCSLHSAAADRPTYLARPDLGRRLDDASRARLAAMARGYDLVLRARRRPVGAGRGIPCRAAARREPAAASPRRLADRAGRRRRTGPRRHRRRDRQHSRRGAGLRPDRRAPRPDLARQPRRLPDLAAAIGRTDAERNCLSNIRPAGMAYAEAAQRLVYLCTQARRRRCTGVMLKDETPVNPPLLRASGSMPHGRCSNGMRECINFLGGDASGSPGRRTGPAGAFLGSPLRNDQASPSCRFTPRIPVAPPWYIV